MEEDIWESVRLLATNNPSLNPYVPTAPRQSQALQRGKLSLLSAHNCWEKTLKGIP